MINLDKASFEAKISSPDPVIVDFWAPWCGPCLALAPLLEQIEEERGGKGEITKLNVDDFSEISGKYGVASIPTMIVFKDSKEVDRVVGGRPKDEIIALLEKNR